MNSESAFTNSLIINKYRTDVKDEFLSVDASVITGVSAKVRNLHFQCSYLRFSVLYSHSLYNIFCFYIIYATEI